MLYYNYVFPFIQNPYEGQISGNMKYAVGCLTARGYPPTGLWPLILHMLM